MTFKKIFKHYLFDNFDKERIDKMGLFKKKKWLIFSGLAILAVPAFALSGDVLKKIKSFQLGRYGTEVTNFRIVPVTYPAATGITGTIPVVGIHSTDRVFATYRYSSTADTSTTANLKGVKPSTNALSFTFTAAPNATHDIIIDCQVWEY